VSPKALLTLSVLHARYAICRLDPKEEVPSWANDGEFLSVTRTPSELAIVCREDKVPPGINSAAGWRILRCEGPLDFRLTGIVASLAEPLADAAIAIFPIATHDTDYILIREPQLDTAILALTAYGHAVRI